MTTTWLMSLHKEYAEGIVNGEKGFEYRRVKMGAKIGDRVLIYVTHPTKRVIGEFTVGPKSQFGIAAMTAIMGAPQDEWDDLAYYFEGAKCVSALEVENPVRYQTPRKLDEMCGLSRGPMSYCRVENVN